MEQDLDQFRRDLTDRLDWLLGELKRLSAENRRLLHENRKLREEATLARLHTDLGSEADLPGNLVEGTDGPALSQEALQFYRNLPDKINFTEFFRHAESAGLSSGEAREYMLSFFRHGLLEQRGRSLEKSALRSGAGRRAAQDA